MLPLFELNAINVQDNQPGAVLVSTIPSVKFLALGSFWEVIEQAYLSPAFSRALPYNFPKTSQTQKLPKAEEFCIRDRIGSSLTCKSERLPPQERSYNLNYTGHITSYLTRHTCLR